MYLIGQYDGRTIRGYKLHLHFNNSKTKFDTQAESPLDSAAEWLTDLILSNPKKIEAWEHKVGNPNPVYYRYSFTNYKWGLPVGNLILTHTFKTKNGPNEIWVPIG